MMLRMLKSAAKILVRKVAYIPYGWNPWNDVKRLSVALDKCTRFLSSLMTAACLLLSHARQRFKSC